MYKNKKETKKENKEVLLDNVCVCVSPRSKLAIISPLFIVLFAKN